MQQLALLALMMEEKEGAAKLEDARFRSMIIAYHLGESKKILEVIDGAKEHDDRFAPELTEEEMQDYEPYSAEESQAAIDMLRNFGLIVE